MDNEKIFEFMEKIYNQLQETRSELQETRSEMKNGFKELREEVRKNLIRLDSLEKKVDILAEVQSSHMKQNENNHVEMVEMLSGEIELTQQAVSKLTAVK